MTRTAFLLLIALLSVSSVAGPITATTLMGDVTGLTILPYACCSCVHYSVAFCDGYNNERRDYSATVRCGEACGRCYLFWCEDLEEDIMNGANRHGRRCREKYQKCCLLAFLCRNKMDGNRGQDRCFQFNS